MKRDQVLDKAAKLVGEVRNAVYGPPTADFGRTAAMLTALGFRFERDSIESHHVAMIMAVVKLSRLAASPGHEDSWVDLAGYAACGAECAEEPVRECAEEPVYDRDHSG